MTARSSPGSPVRGRPRKYGRPARAITLTLPEDVLGQLLAVDADLGRAIVKVVEGGRAPRTAAIRPAEIVRYGRHAVILVTPVKPLKRLPGVQLVPMGNGRCLISLDPGHSIPQLEIDIRDALARGGITPLEQDTLETIAGILRDARISHVATPEERTIIVFESRRQRRAT